jgi:hypothetical protein
MEQASAVLQDVVRALAQDAADEIPAAVLVVCSESGFDTDVERTDVSPHPWTAAWSRPLVFSWTGPVRSIPVGRT